MASTAAPLVRRDSGVGARLAAIVAVYGSLALAACGGKGDESLGENVQSNYENAAENLDAMADNTINAVAADTLVTHEALA